MNTHSCAQSYANHYDICALIHQLPRLRAWRVGNIFPVSGAVLYSAYDYNWGKILDLP